MFVRLLAYTAVIMSAVVLTVKVSGVDDEVRAAIENEYLGGIKELVNEAKGKSEILKAFVTEVKDNRGHIVEDELCDRFLFNVSVTADFVEVTGLSVEGMLANLSAKVEDVVACYQESDGWEEPSEGTPPCNGSSKTSVDKDGVTEFNDFIGCLGKPVSDMLDCLDDNLGQLEAMRQDYVRRTGDYEQDFEVRMKGLYGGLKRCLFDMRPTVQPSTGTRLQHSALLIIFGLALILNYLR